MKIKSHHKFRPAAIRLGMLFALLVLALGVSLASSSWTNAQSPPTGPRGAAPPDGLSDGEWGSIQTQILAAQYQFTWQTRDGQWAYRAPNREQGFSVALAADGLQAQGYERDGAVAWEFGLALTDYGSEPASLSVQRTRVEYDWQALSEWYANRPEGMEHGLTLAAPPPGTDGSQVELTFALRGNLTPRLDASGQALRLQDDQGSTILLYDQLAVHDATGRQLPSSLSLSLSQISLVVDAAGAAYPLTVDSLLHSETTILHTSGAQRPPSAMLASDLYSETTILHASDAQVDDYFGFSVSISGDTLVVGAYEEDGGAGDPTNKSGAAYVFERDQGGTDNWGEAKMLRASDAQSSDRFGKSVSISGNTLVVGAFKEDGGAGDPIGNAGAAYVFERNLGGADNWGEVKVLHASDAQANNELGQSVSISGDTLIVGASGTEAAYVFERDLGGADNWGEADILHPSDVRTDDEFGWSVSISGNTLVVGAYEEDGGEGNPTNASGAAYVFERDLGGADNWGEAAILHASDAQVEDEFGWSVSISGDTLVVGANEEDGIAVDPLPGSGAVYVFERNLGGADNWGEADILHASDAQAGDHFGKSVSISGNTFVVGALYAGEPGAAYVFERDEGGVNTWDQVEVLHPSDGKLNDRFGQSVSISGYTLVVGAYMEDGGEGNPVSGSGAAYVFECDPGTVYVTQWGSNGSGDGQFNTPMAVAIDSAGNVYVADQDNNRIQKFDSDGNFLVKWGSGGSGDGQFYRPRGVAVDAAGNVYVADTWNHRVQVFDSNGNFIRKWGVPGAGNGQFKYTVGITVDDAGNVYVVDGHQHRIQKFDNNGNFLLKWGSWGSGTGQFMYPEDVGIDGAGNVYVLGERQHRVQVFDASGGFVNVWSGSFDWAYAIGVDVAGNAYIGDFYNHRIQKYDSSGNLLAQWGSEGSGVGQFNIPRGIEVDGDGNVYVADTNNHRIQKFYNTPPAMTTTAYASSDTPRSDTTQIVSTLNVPDSGVAQDVNVTLNIAHTWLWDMKIYLLSPSGTQVQLFNQRGGSANNLTNTGFDDLAAYSIASGAAPFNGVYQPEFPLSAFNGEPIQGDWQLIVDDVYPAADHGTLQNWTLELTHEPGTSMRSAAMKSPSALSAAPGNCSGSDISLIDSGDIQLTVESVRVSYPGDWGCQINGKLHVQLPGNDVSDIPILGSVNADGDLKSFNIMDFELDIADLKLTIENAEFYDDALRSMDAYLQAPDEWGGLYNAVGDMVTIDDYGLYIGYGEFTLPTLLAGAFDLDLTGALSPQVDGYEIVAYGYLGAASLANEPNCSLQVETTIATDGQLGALTPRVACHRQGIAIGQTGFVLSDVSGTFDLQPDSQTVDLASATVQSTEHLDGVPVIQGTGPATLDADGLTLNAALDVLGLSTAATDVTLSEGSGLTALVAISSTDLHATLPLQAWQNGDQFNLTGSGAGAIRHPSLGWLRNTETHLGQFGDGSFGFSGQNAQTGFVVDDQGDLSLRDTNALTLTTLTVDASDLSAAEIAWDLAADNAPATLGFYAQAGQINQTLTFTDPLGSGSGSFDTYQGILVAQVEAGAGAGTLTVDLSTLESGDVSLWAQADDGVTTPLYQYATNALLRSTSSANAVASIPIDNSSTLTESWTTPITISTNIEWWDWIDATLGWDVTLVDGLFIQWDPHTSADVDGYAVYVSTKPTAPLTATGVVTTGDSLYLYYDQTGQPIGDHYFGIAIWENVDPNQTYYVSVGAYDEDSGQVAMSDQVSKFVSLGDFGVSAPVESFRMDAGETVTATLVISMTPDLFYDIYLQAHPPTGISETVEIVDMYMDGENTLVEVEAYLTAGADLANGDYVVPFALQSGELFREQEVHLLVGRQPYDPYYVVVPPEGISDAPFGNGVTLTVPASGTFGEVVTFTLTPQSPTSTLGLMDMHRFFTLEIHNASGSAVLPPGPFTLATAYDPDDLPNAMSEATLAWYYYLNGWQKEATSQVDTGAHTVTASPDHLSLWALLFEYVADAKVYLPIIMK